MTDAQHEVLLALNLRQMQMADGSLLHETGVFTSEVATICGRSRRSTAAALSAAARLGWVASRSGDMETGWILLRPGVLALEAERGVRP